jgi:hypothetical protein
LAAEVPDAETVALAERFALRHRERVLVLERKIVVQRRAALRREAEMAASTGARPAPAADRRRLARLPRRPAPSAPPSRHLAAKPRSGGGEGGRAARVSEEEDGEGRSRMRGGNGGVKA